MSDKKYIPTIGLEIHAELKTQTKMFCNSKNDSDEERPNVNVCPICMGHPGTLPVINKEAVKHVLKVGVAVSGKLADFTEFDRKNYFYPDIPKGYQISQYKYPLVTGGKLNGIDITRVHLEEDTATSLHEEGDYSLVDFNRAGMPLMELVTEPVIHSAKEAGDFARELQLLLRYLGVSDANMEKGEMRVEANISVSDSGAFGTKVEVKNLNSFKSVERAIEYEVERHIEILKNGEKLAQETRGWDEAKQQTYSQRAKEESHDYRYFPDPDLPKILLKEIPEFKLESLKKQIPELPPQKRERYAKEYFIKPADIEIFISSPEYAAYFEAVIRQLGSDAKEKKLIQSVANYFTSDYLGLLKGIPMSNVNTIPVGYFAELMVMNGEGIVGSRAAKDILAILLTEKKSPKEIAQEHGLLQKSDKGELRKIVKAVLEANSKVVTDYKNGKEAALQFLIGQGMKATKGSANPATLVKLIRELTG